MRAILIDSINKTVVETTIDDTEKVLDQWYKAINCDLVEIAHYITNHDSILVDEEGYLKNPKHFFSYNGGHQPFAGNGLIVGVNDEGESVDCDITLEEATENIMFLTEDELRAYYQDEQETGTSAEGSSYRGSEA